MQENSVSSSQSFKSAPLELRVLSALNDDQLKSIAYAKAKQDVQDKKHRRLSNMLYYSVPLAAGLAAGVSPSHISRLGRLKDAVGHAVGVAVPFAVLDGAFAAKSSLDRHSETSAQFTKKHPLIATFGTVVGAIAAIVGFNKLADKVGVKYGKKVIDAAKPKLETLAKKLDSSKVLNFVSKQLNKLPSALKEISKTALSWAPWMLVFANIAHTISHENAKNMEYVKNFQELKTAQQIIKANLAS